MNGEEIILFTKKEDCCGCAACLNICPKNAISMNEDDYGFLFPEIDFELCINCRLCKKVCGYQKNEEMRTTYKTYVAMSKDTDILKKSASGGIFATIASEVIDRGGVVFGCAMEQEGDLFSPQHIRVDNKEFLEKLYGSKYVQSDVRTNYQIVKQEISAGKLVLFSGTPCQVSGLKNFLEMREYENLLTIEIICHGVPSSSFFNGYIKTLENKLDGKIKSINFRDKTDGWGLNARVKYISKKGEVREKRITSKLSSYYDLFLNSCTYRESCYSCKYSGQGRCGDLTIGDYWGISEEHPDYLSSNYGEMDETKGISCVLVNSVQGEMWLNQFGKKLIKKSSSFEKVANHNSQLKEPSIKNKNREVVLELFLNEGYNSVENWYFKIMGRRKILYMFWGVLPKWVRIKLKMYLT